MGTKRYRGPVETVEQAMMAGAVLTITCQHCSHSSSMRAYRLAQRVGTKAMLRKAVSGFRCYGCKARVQVVMRPEGPW